MEDDKPEPPSRPPSHSSPHQQRQDPEKQLRLLASSSCPDKVSPSERVSEELPVTADDLAAEAIEAKETAPDHDHPSADNGNHPQQRNEEAVFSVIPKSQKILMIVAISFIGLLSPLTGSVYLPAIPDIARSLQVTPRLINLTITTYQIFQGLAPSLIASIADTRGRRPAYVLALLIYLVANLALALQNSYAALMVLRCLQSAGSSATIALAGAVVSDMVTRAERGSYIGWATMGISLGPALGPVAGGLLSGYLGWRAIFWFLLIFGGVLFSVVVLLLPETCRAVVGNGSVRPQWWNLSAVQWLRRRKGDDTEIEEDRSTITKPRHRPNPLSAMRILLEPEGGITLGFGSLLFAGYFMVMTTLSEQLSTRFSFDSVQIGLCYLPLGVGSLLSRVTAGQLFDWNFHRHSRKLGVSLDLSRQQAIDVFPIERIRLEICIPMVYISCGTVLAYAWAMESNASLAGIEAALFFQGLFFSGALSGMNMLIVDTHQDTPATATAANNLFRCLMSAGGTALAPILIERIGVGFMGVFISGVWLLFTPCLWLVMFQGPKWREEQKKREVKDAEKGKGH